MPPFATQDHMTVIGFWKQTAAANWTWMDGTAVDFINWCEPCVPHTDVRSLAL